MVWLIGGYIVIGISVFALCRHYILDKLVDSLMRDKKLSILDEAVRFIIICSILPFICILFWPFLVLSYLEGFMSVIVKKLRS